MYIQVKDEKNNIQLDDVNSIKKEEEWEKCLICFEMFKEENGSKLPCGHCCCQFMSLSVSQNRNF